MTMRGNLVNSNSFLLPGILSKVEKDQNIGHRLVETDKNGRKIAVLKTRKAKRKFCYLT